MTRPGSVLRAILGDPEVGTSICSTEDCALTVLDADRSSRDAADDADAEQQQQPPASGAAAAADDAP